MTLFFWITGLLLAFLWLDRVRDAYTGMSTVTDISKPEWDLIPGTPFKPGAPPFRPFLAEGGDVSRPQTHVPGVPFESGLGLSGDASQAKADLQDREVPRLCIIVPARNEEPGAPPFRPFLAEGGDVSRPQTHVPGVPFVPGLGLSGDASQAKADLQDREVPRLCIIVPARNEEQKVEASLKSLLRLDYPNYEVIAINDRSTDSTGEILDRLAATHIGSPALRVLHISELPSGWLGKPHAMWLAAQQTTADWILFTDADVAFRPDCLRRAIAYGESSGAGHVVLIPTHLNPTFGERLMLSGFAMMFVWGHRTWKVADPKASDWTGAGPFNLIRREAYEKIGTFRALRMEVIEDMKLGKLVKQHGFAQRVVLGRGLLLWHWGHGAFGIIRNLTKNMFASMQFNWGRAFGGSLLFVFLNLLPFVGLALAPGWAKIFFAVAVAAIAALYGGLSRLMPVSALWVVLHPVSSLLLLYTLFKSMAHAARHRGVIWRGTWYSLEDLRKGMV